MPTGAVDTTSAYDPEKIINQITIMIAMEGMSISSHASVDSIQLLSLSDDTTSALLMIIR